MSCPDLLVLSQLLDDELAADEARSVKSHAIGCPDCQVRFDRLARALSSVSLARIREATRLPLPAGTPGCLTPEQIAAWLDPEVEPEERALASGHLEGCDTCLSEALGVTRLMSRLDAGNSLPVPKALRSRVAALWPEPPKPLPLTELIVRVTRAGAELLAQRVVAPLLDVVQLAAPAPAFRASGETHVLQFRIRAPAAEIGATVVPAGEAVGVSLALSTEAGQALVDQRVFVRHHGRSIFSARTDRHGELRIPALDRGVYEVSCPGLQVEFRLDLRGH